MIGLQTRKVSPRSLTKEGLDHQKSLVGVRAPSTEIVSVTTVAS